MAVPDPRIVSINELRFRPANSNDRTRAGMEHAFEDVPPCSFAKDDGISPYIGSDSGIDTYPDAPATHEPIHEDVPDVAQDGTAPAISFGRKLLRSGFGLSVFLHAVAALAIGYATITLPNDDALLAGETLIAIEFFSETDSEVTTRLKQTEQEGEEQAVETPVEEPKPEPEPPREEPKQEVAEPVKPVEEPEAVATPVEPAVAADQPEVLSTTQPSDFQIEAAARRILDDTTIAPLPDGPPPMLIKPAEEAKAEPEKTLAQPLAHPVSKPRVVRRIAEVRPVLVKPVEAKPVEAKPVEKPVLKKEEPKPVEKKPEPRKEQPKKKEETKKTEPNPKKVAKKKTAARDGNAETDSNKGSSKADRKDGNSQDASQGNSRNKVKGNAATSNYKGLVQRKLERAKKRVRVAAKGTVVVSFTILASGSVVNLRVRKSSGKPAIDKGALDIVRRASPFPAIPPDSGLMSYPVSVPMTFKGN